MRTSHDNPLLNCIFIFVYIYAILLRLNAQVIVLQKIYNVVDYHCVSKAIIRVLQIMVIVVAVHG